MDHSGSNPGHSRRRMFGRGATDASVLAPSVRVRPVAWALLIVGVALSAVSIVHAHGASAELPTASPEVTTAVAITAVVTLVWAGAMAVHGQRSHRVGTSVVVGLGAIALAVGTIGDIVATLEAAGPGAAPSVSALVAALDLFVWAGLSMMIGALAWQAPMRSPGLVRVPVIVLLTAASLAAASSWAGESAGVTAVERAVLFGLAALAMSVAWICVRRGTATSILDSAAGPAALLSLAIMIEGLSLQTGDLASIAALGWLVTTGLVLVMWFDREATEESSERHRQTLRQLQLVADTRRAFDDVRSDRLTLGHNGSSSLLAIEGALSTLAAQLGGRTADAAESRATTEAVLLEVQRLRRSLSPVDPREPGATGFAGDCATATGQASHRIAGLREGTASGAEREAGAVRSSGGCDDGADSSDPTSVAAAIEPVVTVARAAGALVNVEVPLDLETAARSDVLSEIIGNLLDNASVHAPGATVTIVGRRLIGGSVELVVADDGPGIDPSVASGLFERGVSSRAMGSGLGLYSACELARLSGGSLSLGRGGPGAAFVLHLPPVTAAGGESTGPEHDDGWPADGFARGLKRSSGLVGQAMSPGSRRAVEPPLQPLVAYARGVRP